MSVKQRMDPDPEQVQVMTMHANHARFVWNLGLEQREIKPRPANFWISFYTQNRELTEAREENPWLAAGSRKAQEGALYDLDQAYRNWWSNPAHFGKPTWRSRSKSPQGFIVRPLIVERLNRKWAVVNVPKAGMVKFRLSGDWAVITAAKSARVTVSRTGKWHVSFMALQPAFERTSTGKVVGIDRGVVHTISTSDGVHVSIPTLTPGEQARFLSLEHQFSRQCKGSRYRTPSRRREKTKKELNALRGREKNRRKDWIEKTSTDLVRGYDLIALEDLKIGNMTKAPPPRPDPDKPGAYLPNGARTKAALNRRVAASCWGELARRTKDKAGATPGDHRVIVIGVDPRNTSITCHECGHIDKENRKNQAVFLCTRCDHKANADINAARNILGRALNPKPPDGWSSDVSVAKRRRVKPEKVV